MTKVALKPIKSKNLFKSWAPEPEGGALLHYENLPMQYTEIF